MGWRDWPLRDKELFGLAKGGGGRKRKRTITSNCTPGSRNLKEGLTRVVDKTRNCLKFHKEESTLLPPKESGEHLGTGKR